VLGWLLRLVRVSVSEDYCKKSLGSTIFGNSLHK
jgi:hypothetical protein